MGNCNRIRANFAPMLSADHTVVTSSYAKFSTPTTHNANKVNFVSTYNQTVILSLNGTDDQIVVIAGNNPYDCGANQEQIGGLWLPQGTQFWIKQGADGAPSSGDLYIVIMYGD